MRDSPVCGTIFINENKVVQCVYAFTFIRRDTVSIESEYVRLSTVCLCTLYYIHMYVGYFKMMMSGNNRKIK